MPAILESFKALIHDAVTVSTCLELAVLFTRYEKVMRPLTSAEAPSCLTR